MTTVVILETLSFNLIFVIGHIVWSVVETSLHICSLTLAEISLNLAGLLVVGVYKVVSNIWFKIFLLCVGLELLELIT